LTEKNLLYIEDFKNLRFSSPINDVTGVEVWKESIEEEN
jgi:hypothetical protein